MAWPDWQTSTVSTPGENCSFTRTDFLHAGMRPTASDPDGDTLKFGIVNAPL